MGQSLAVDSRGSVGVVAVVYLEPEWAQTKACLDALGVPIVYVDRGGTGSLAEAYNRGFAETDSDYVWFVSNVTFTPEVLPRLASLMDETGYAAIHPEFASDHPFIASGEGVALAPFVEFTAPIVRADVFREFQLAESMPYWGHDLDWGHRVRQAGHRLAIDHGSRVEHVYIRNSPDNPVTRERQRRRTATNAATKRELVRRYGPEWKTRLGAFSSTATASSLTGASR